MAEPDRCPQDVFEILFASDVHLGFGHKDPIRSRDSLNTFEEILRVGRERGVDFVLLGGDLFHQSNPPKQIVDGAVRALRSHCLGQRNSDFDVVGAEETGVPAANFKDPNLNVALPVFSIHGVHDDPVGIGSRNDGLSILNVLHTAGLINYFGKTNVADEVIVKPFLLQKGITKLAMFGLGAMNEGRLNRLLENGKVHLGSHPDDKPQNWFNIFLLHQNRRKSEEDSGGKGVAEESIDALMDLVIWGHEADCRVDAEWNEQQHFHVTQPGSTIHVKLHDEDVGRKHLGLLRVATLLTDDGQEEKQFKVEKIPLQTVRQFYSREIRLADLVDTSNTELDVKTQVENICRHQIEEMISQAAAEHNGIQPKEPLIKLKVNKTSADGRGAFETFNLCSFSQSFEGRVANPKDVVVFCQRRPRHLNPYARRSPPAPTTEFSPATDLKHPVAEPATGETIQSEQNGDILREAINGNGHEDKETLMDSVINGAAINGTEQETMETEAPLPEPVEETKPDVKEDVSFYQEDIKGGHDESVVDEVGAMSDLVQNYFKDSNDKSSMGIYAKEALTSAMCCYAENNLTDSLSEYVYKQLENVQAKMENKLNITDLNRDEVSQELAALMSARVEGDVDDDEQRVLDEAVKVATDKKARLLAKRAREPDVEDVEVMVLPSVKRGKGAAKPKPTTVSKLGGAINERGIPYVVLNDIPDLPPRAPQPARKSRANKSYYVDQFSDEDDDEYRPMSSPKKRRR